MDTEVVSLLEGAVARVSGIDNIRSASEENNGRIYLEFRPGTDIDSAAADVREAVSRVARRLPDRVEQVVVVKADDDAQAVVSLAAWSDSLTEESLTRLVEKDIVPMLIAIDGVADVQLSGNRQRVLRVALDPLRLTSYGLSVGDVAAALRQAPFDVPAGSFRSAEQQLIVRADATAVDASQVRDIIVRDSIRIGDVANVYFGPEDAEIEISDGIMAAVARVNTRFDDLELVVTDDQALFIRDSVSQVLITLGLSLLIVVATIWLFIGSLRATLVPAIAIPVSLIGTVAAIWLFGFSINILTLLALVLATGLVVDDAIVVLENIQRQRADGLRARAAAVIGTRQVFFAVVATTAVLVSVFVPISFLGGTTGLLFREFGIVLAGAVVISSFVALSLVPAAAARLVKAGNEQHVPGKIGRIGAAIARAYERSLGAVLDRAWLAIVAAVLFAGGAVLAYQALAKELVPSEDRGALRILATGPDGVGISYIDRQTEQIEALLQPLLDTGEAQSINAVVGNWDPNRSLLTVPLADWSERERSQQEIANALRGQLAGIPGARVVMWGGNSLNLRTWGSGLRVALLGNDYDDIFEAAKTYARAIEERIPEDGRDRPTPGGRPRRRFRRARGDIARNDRWRRAGRPEYR
jgi:multidrug efflux pump subunit AcrB